MSTLQDRIESSVQTYVENAQKIHKFINGSESESIASESGDKPTVAKIIKNTEDVLASSMTELRNKASQVSEDRSYIQEVKLNLDDVLAKLNAKYSGGLGSEIGSIVAFPVESVPQGFLICDGSTIQKETYPDLVLFLTKDENVTEVTLPDLRGEFIRGADLGRGVDANRVVGSYQEDAMQNIYGRFRGGDADNNYTSGPFKYESTYHGSIAGGGTAQICHYSFDSSRVVRTAEETRPRNYAVVLAIKAFGKVVTNGAINLNGLAQEFNSTKTQIAELASAFADGFANNKVTSGYTNLPNGLILQWGHLSSGVNVTRNFTIAFPTNCLAMAGTNKNVTNWSYGVGLKPISRTQFRSLIQHGDGGMWFAVGY